MDSVRIGVIGIGRMARKHHIPCLQRVDGLEIVATCDLREERTLPGAHPYTDVRTMLAQETLDAVYVLTPPGAHLEPVCLALDRGCHVFCEMPPALEPLDAAQMAEFARDAGRTLLFGTNRHFSATYQGIKQIADGEAPKMTVLAKCRHGLRELSQDFCDALDIHTAQHFTVEGTPMFLGITQFLDIAEWLNGPIVDCEATPSPLCPDMRTMTRAVSILRHANGARSMISYEEFGPQAYENVTVHSSASTYIIRGSMMQPNELLVWTADGHQTFPAPSDPQERGGFLDQSRYFLRCVREQTPRYPDGMQLARLIHLARKIDGSAWWADAGDTSDME